MIGTETDAALALADALPIFSDLGSTRIVYRVGNVVYKVNCGDWGYDCNLAEWNAINGMAKLPDGVYVPDTALYNVNGKNVIAMEFIEGTAVAECYCATFGDKCDSTCMSNEVWEKISGYLADTSGFNTIITENGDIYLIDLA